MATQSTQTNEHSAIWENEAEARMLENRLNGFWNADYFTKILLPLLNLKPGSRVLDVGAGTGALTLLLARHNPEVQFTGIDVTATMVADAQAQAQKLGLNNVEFQEGDALNLPFPNGFFDAAMCQTLLIHLSNPAQAVLEMSRVIKPGGTFMAAEYHMLFVDLPIEADRLMPTNKEAVELGRLTQIILDGYRTSGQGDMKLGGRVPFLAVDAGLSIVDVRINDRVAHAFPPYNKPGDKIAIAELQSWETVIRDPGYIAWLRGAITAGGGTNSDVDILLDLLPKHEPEIFSPESNFAFVWLVNPVLLVTIARKPG